MENRPNAQTIAAAAGSMMLAARALFFKTKHFFLFSWRAAQMASCTRTRHSCSVPRLRHYHSDGVRGEKHCRLTTWFALPATHFKELIVLENKKLKNKSVIFRYSTRHLVGVDSKNNIAVSSR